MNDEEITALAKGVAPFVRDCVTEAVGKSLIVSPELAEQIAGAVRLLHEEPPPVVRSEPPHAPSLPKLTRIKRDEDGNFVPVYDEPQA